MMIQQTAPTVVGATGGNQSNRAGKRLKFVAQDTHPRQPIHWGVLIRPKAHIAMSPDLARYFYDMREACR